MTTAALSRAGIGVFVLVLAPVAAVGAEPAELAQKAQAVLKTYCHRCHGQDGAVEGGMNFVLDRDKLTARRKIVPGDAERSPLYRRVADGKMPPPDEKPRPGPDALAVLRQWIDAGAPATSPVVKRPPLSEADVAALILADLDRLEKRSRRFQRYFTLTHLWNAGLGDDELQSYRHALAKLLNSLSWHPRLALPRPADPDRLVLRIDVRDLLWDANVWNRILAEYPYGFLPDTAAGRGCCVGTGSRLPFVRADWFVATASRTPLYHDLLQLPASVAELERQLRVDAAADIRQERVARAGFNGSGVARNNRLLERHDAAHGAYWRSYDFDSVPQNLVERDNLLPDRRNLFAHPLGPGFTEQSFQHAGGEVIFNLPNGLQGYLLIDANGRRVDRAPTALVSDPRRPDRAVETGLSCIGCHVGGIHPKTDQVRDHVAKNPQAFSPNDADLVRALYVPEAKMKALMEEDAERFRKALAKIGVRLTTAEPVLTMALRYEADVDLTAAAAELGLPPVELTAKIGRLEGPSRNLGALRVTGGTVQRAVWVQALADLARELRLGSLLRPETVRLNLPDNSGEIDPLEGPSEQANAASFAADGRRVLFASADRSVRLWDVEAGRELRRFVGHTASVWSVAFSSDGRRALSGGMDGSVRLWEVDRGRELVRLNSHEGLVSSVAFSRDGRRGLSGGYDGRVCMWDLENGTLVRALSAEAGPIQCVAFAPDGRRVLAGAGRLLLLWDGETGELPQRFEGHGRAVVAAAFSPRGDRLLSGGDDGTVRVWDVVEGKEIRRFEGHRGPVRALAWAQDGTSALSGGTDGSVRWWDVKSGRELTRFEDQRQPVVGVALSAGGRHVLSAATDSAVREWRLP